MKSIKLLLVLMSILLFSLGTLANVSSHRPQHEDWKVTKQKYTAFALLDRSDSAETISVDSEQTNLFSKLEKLNAPTWKYEDVLKAFRLVRDHKFLKDSMHGELLRRSSWLYPDDGCFARAGLMVKNAEDFGFPKMNKLFSFGNLSVVTSNSPFGEVSWWYHVVPVVRTEREVYVLDPAIEPMYPLTAQDWLIRQGDEKIQIKVSVCDGDTYEPFSSCFEMDKETSEKSLTDQGYYLDLEWERLLELDRDPVRELGDFPPWEWPMP